MNKIDILAIGDIATDVFIKITEAEAKCDIGGGHCKLCLNYGGKIPYESSKICHAVGNSSNFIIGASRLGVNSALMANMGDDQNGAECLNKLKEENIDTTFIKIEKDKLTSYHYVLWYEKEHTILTKHEEYKYEWPKDLEKENSPSWIYLSSLGKNSLHFQDEIVNYLERNPNVKLAFQPGTFQIRLGVDAIKDIYKKTDVFFCNNEEAKSILDLEESVSAQSFDETRKDISMLIEKIHALGPKLVVITDGINGAYAYDGNEIIFVEAQPSDSFVETTGAGDAFASAFMTAYLNGKDIRTSLLWGSINAVSVISYVGPHEGLLMRKEIEGKIK